MLFCKTSAFSVLTIVSLCLSATVDSETVNVLDEEDKSKLHGLSPAFSAQQPLFMPAMDSLFSHNLLAAFAPEDLEIGDYCVNLLRLFQTRYIAYLNCLVPAARPVKVCLNCFEGYAALSEVYANISNSQMAPDNSNCRDLLLRSDRLMLIYLLYSNLQSIWTNSACQNCFDEHLQFPTNLTQYFMNELNESLSCFEKYQQGNHSELCVKCKSKYESLNVLYGSMKKDALCIDIEDAMNMTRRLWSSSGCIAPREEIIPVIAVSCFMLFLPIVFYLSSYLHSEQKKLKLIHPKRAKSNNSLMNIQDKFS